MFGGIDDVFGLQVRFDSKKVDSSSYGDICWDVFCECFDLNLIGNLMSPSIDFFSGDTDDSTFSICVETLPFPEHDKVIDSLKARLSNSADFNKIAANPGLINYAHSVQFEHYSPVLKFGKLDYGKLEWEAAGYTYMAKAAFEKVLNKQ